MCSLLTIATYNQRLNINRDKNFKIVVETSLYGHKRVKRNSPKKKKKEKIENRKKNSCTNPQTSFSSRKFPESCEIDEIIKMSGRGRARAASLTRENSIVSRESERA